MFDGIHQQRHAAHAGLIQVYVGKGVVADQRVGHCAHLPGDVGVQVERCDQGELWADQLSHAH